jgi:hypothetical protein
LTALLVCGCNGGSQLNVSGFVGTGGGSGGGSTASPYTATFKGWTTITASGAVVPAAQGTDLSSAPAQVTLAWNAVTLNSGVVASYNIYRATSSGGENYASPLATGITTAAATYTDTSALTAGTTYYYTIAPVVAGIVSPVTSSTDSEVSVTIPPSNMTLIHPWMANQTMCALMGRATVESNGYGCTYSGPGNVGGYYKQTKSIFIDTYGQGCNYTVGTDCQGGTCLGTANSTPGNGVPSLTGVDGDVFYDRKYGACYLHVAGNWISNTQATAAQLAQMISNAPGLPPIAWNSQNLASGACNTVTQSGFTNSERLPKHSEQILAGAWSPSLSAATISALESDSGGDLTTTHACNTNNGAGLTFDNNNPPADLNTLPGNFAGGYYVLRNGNTDTTSCVSVFGVHDMIGNLQEWASDQLTGCATGICTGLTSALDPNNTDWNGFIFNETIGPAGTTGAEKGYLSSENLTYYGDSAPFSYFQVPLGLPIVTMGSASTWDALTIGGAAGQFATSSFYNAALNLQTGTGDASRGALGGGWWLSYLASQTAAGLFTLDVTFTPMGYNQRLGFRCALTGN